MVEVESDRNGDPWKRKLLQVETQRSANSSKWKLMEVDIEKLQETIEIQIKSKLKRVPRVVILFDSFSVNCNAEFLFQ